MNYKIKIILTITLFIAFAFNKVDTIQKENKNQIITEDWYEKDKNIKNPELKQLLEELKKEFMFENDILKKDFKKKKQKLKEDYSLKREAILEKYKIENKEVIKSIPKEPIHNKKDKNNTPDIKKKPIDKK